MKKQLKVHGLVASILLISAFVLSPLLSYGQTSLPDFVAGIDINPTGDKLAVGLGFIDCNASEESYSIEILQLNTLEHLQTLREPRCIHYPVWSPSGQMLASSGGDGRVFVWDTNTGNLVSDGNAVMTMGTSSLSWSADETRLAGIIGGAYAVDFNDVQTGERLPAIGTVDAVYNVRFHPIDPNILATGEGDGKIRLWTLDGQLQDSFVVSNKHVKAVFWNSDGSQLLAYTANRLHILDSTNRTIIRQIDFQIENNDPTIGLTSLYWSRDNRLIAVGSSSGRISIWDASNGSLVYEFESAVRYVQVVIVDGSQNNYDVFYAGLSNNPHNLIQHIHISLTHETSS